MGVLSAIANWIKHSVNKITEFFRQMAYCLILFGILDWTPEQQIGALMALSAFLAMFTEGSTVPQARVGERVAEKMAAMNNTGDGGVKPPGGPTFPTVLFILSFGLLAGCAANVPPNTSPEGKLAAQALPVTAALRGVIPSIKPMVCTNTTQTECLKVSDAQLVIANIDRALRVVERLALVLKVVDESTTTDGKISAMLLARQAMNEIQREISEAAIAPGDEFARQAVSGLLRTVTESMFLIGGK